MRRSAISDTFRIVGIGLAICLFSARLVHAESLLRAAGDRAIAGALDSRHEGGIDVSLSKTPSASGIAGIRGSAPASCGRDPRLFVVNACDDRDDGACDAGHCSLREAISEANACPTSDTIGFAADEARCAIFLESQLPPVTQPVLIDATTAGGRAVELAGVGLAEEDGGLVIDADGTVVRGLTMSSFGKSAIHLRNASRCRVESNVIVGEGSPSSVGVLVEGGAENVVGGTEPEQGNRIEGPHGSGVGIGVALRPGANGPARANRIEGNHIFGMGLGVLVIGLDNTIGGLAPGAGNTIAGSRDAGVLVSGGGASSGNAILFNSITGVQGLAIGLGREGSSPNDALDEDHGANGLQNHPVLESAVLDDETVTVAGFLRSRPFTEYGIELFASSLTGPAETHLGSFAGMSDAAGKLEFEAAFRWTSLPVGTIVATATSIETYDTSELSDPVTIRHADRDGHEIADGR